VSSSSISPQGDGTGSRTTVGTGPDRPQAAAEATARREGGGRGRQDPGDRRLSLHRTTLHDALSVPLVESFDPNISEARLGPVSGMPVDHSPISAPYTLVASPGSVVVKARGGQESPDYVRAADRRPAERWSSYSRGRMVKRFASLDYAPLYPYCGPSRMVPLMVTLTLPGDWESLVPSPGDFQDMFRRFRRRLARALYDTDTLPLIWKLEFQRRGAPHLHILVSLPLSIGGEAVTNWVSRTWYEVVGSGDPAHLKAGTGIDWSESQLLTDGMRMAVYFSRHSNAGASKGYQHEIPDLWKGQRSFRFWGYSALRPDETTYELNRAQGYEAIRLMRKHYFATHPPVFKGRQRGVWIAPAVGADPSTGHWEQHWGRLFERRVKRGASPTTGELRFRYVYRRPHSHSLQGDHRGRGGFVLSPGASDLSAAVMRAVVDIEEAPLPTSAGVGPRWWGGGRDRDREREPCRGYHREGCIHDQMREAAADPMRLVELIRAGDRRVVAGALRQAEPGVLAFYVENHLRRDRHLELEALRKNPVCPEWVRLLDLHERARATSGPSGVSVDSDGPRRGDGVTSDPVAGGPVQGGPASQLGEAPGAHLL
jgi:hypothetical protein